MDKGAITATTEAVQMYTTSLQRIHREKGAAPVRSDFQLSPQRLSMLEKTGPAVTKPRQRTVVSEAAPVRIVTDAERAAAEKTARKSEAKTKRRVEDDEFFREVKAAAVKPNPSSAPQPSPRSHADPLAQTMGGSVGTEPPPEDASTRATEQLIHRILGPRGPGTLRCRPGTQYDGTAVLESSEALMAERREREAIRASQRTLEQALVYVNSMQQNAKSAEVAGQFQEETLVQLHGAKARRVEARREGATALRQLMKLHRLATPPTDGPLGPLGSGHGSGTLGDAPDPDLPTGPGRALVTMDAETAQPSPAHERSIGSSGGRLTPLDTAPRPHASPLHSPKGAASIMRGIDVPPTFGLPEAPALPRSTKDRRYYGRAASIAADPTLQREKDWDWTEALPCPIGSTSKVRPQQLLHPHEAPKPKLDDVQEILTVLRKEGVHAVKPTSAMTQVVCAQHVYGTPALRSKSHRAMLPALRREAPPPRVALFGLTPEQEDAARKAAAAKASGNASLATHSAGWAQRRTSTPSVGASRPPARRASGDKAADSLTNAQLVEAEPEQNVSAADGETPAKPESGGPSSPRPDQNPSEERRDAEPVDEKEAATEEAAALEDSYGSEDYGEGTAAPDGAEPKNNSEQASAVPAGQGRGDSVEKPQGVADDDEAAKHSAVDETETAVVEESDAYADEFDDPAATASDIHGEAPPPQETSSPRPVAAPAAAPEADEYDDEFEDHHADAAADDAAPGKRQAGSEKQAADEKDEDVHDEYADEFEEHEVAPTKPREVEVKEDAKRDETAADTHDEYADEFEEQADAAPGPKEETAVEDGHDEYADEFEATPATSPRTGPQPKSVEATAAAAEEKEDEYADEFETTPAVSPDKKTAAAKTEEAHDDYDEEFDTPAVSPDKAKAAPKPQDAHAAEGEEVYDEEFDHSPAVSPKKSPWDVKPTAEADVDEEYGDEFDEEPVDATAGATPSAAPGAGKDEPVGEPELDAHDEYDEEFDHDSPRQPTQPSGKELGTVEDSTRTEQPPAAVDDHDEYSDEYHSDHEQADPEALQKPDPAAGEPQPTAVKPQSEADTRTPESAADPAAVTPAEEHGDGEDEELPANTTSEAFAEEHDAAHHSPAEAPLMDSVGSTAIHSSEPTEAGASDGARRASAFRDNFRAFAGGSEGHSPAMSPGMSPRALALALGPDGKPPPPRRTSVMPYEEPERRRRRESTKPAVDREAVLDAADDATDDGCLDTVGDTPRRPTAVSALAIGADGKLPPPRRTSIAPYEEPGRFRRQASMAGNMHPLEHGDVSDDSEGGAAYEPTPHAAPAGVGALAIGNDGQLPAPRRTSIAPYEEPERRRRRHSTVPGDANPLADAGRVSPAPDCSITSGPVGASRSQRRLRRQESVITILPHDEDASTSARSPAESPPPPHDGDGGSGAGASATMSPPLSPSAARPSMSVMKNSMFNPLSSIHTTPAAPEALSRARVTSVSSFVADDVQETSSVGTHDDHSTAKATDDAPPIHDATHPDAGRSEPKPHDAPMAEAVDDAEVESKSDGVVTDNHTAQGDQLGSDAKDDGGYSDDGFDTAEASPLQGKPVSGEARKEATDEGRDVDAPSPDSDGVDDYDDGFDSPESPKKVGSSHTLPGSETGGGPETEENAAASPDVQAYDDSFDSPDSPKKVAPPAAESPKSQEQEGGEGKHEKDSNGGEEPQGDDYGDEGFDSPDGSPKDGHTVATGKDHTDQDDAPRTTSGSDEVPPGDAEPKTFNDSASSTNSAFAEAAKEVAAPLPASSPTQEGSGTAPGCSALDPATLGPADVPSRFESGRTSRRSGGTSDTTPTVGASPSKGPGTARPGEDDAADAAPASRPASTLMDVLQRLATPARPTPIATPASTGAGAERSSSSQQQQQQQPPVVVTSATDAAGTDDDDSDYDDDGFETPVGVNAADLESSTTSSAASSVASAGLQGDRLQPGSGRPPPAPTSERTTPLMPSSDGDVFTGRANRPRGSRGSSKSTPTLPASPEATDEAFLLAALLQQQRTASRQGSRQGSRQAPRSRPDGTVSVSVSGDNSGRPGEVPRNVGTPGGLGDGWGFASGSVSFEDSARPGRRPTSRASRGDGSRTSTPQRGNVSGGNVWNDVTAGVSVEPPPALSAPLEDKKSKKDKKEKKDKRDKKDRHHDTDLPASRGEKPDKIDKIDKKDKDKERKREKKARRNPFGDDDGFAPIPAEGRRRRRGESNGDVFDL